MGITPIAALDYVKNEMTKIFPLGVYMNIDAAQEIGGIKMEEKL